MALAFLFRLGSFLQIGACTPSGFRLALADISTSNDRDSSRSLRLFQQRKPSETKEWQQKLPDFVLRLEEAVYRGARTKVRTFRLRPMERPTVARSGNRSKSAFGGFAAIGSSPVSTPSRVIECEFARSDPLG